MILVLIVGGIPILLLGIGAFFVTRSAIRRPASVKKCQFCAEQIMIDAQVCRFCGRNLV
jgi:hypothetical protein